MRFSITIIIYYIHDNIVFPPFQFFATQQQQQHTNRRWRLYIYKKKHDAKPILVYISIHITILMHKIEKWLKSVY